MVLFKDINKTASDILNKDYPIDKTWEIEHKSKCPNPQLTLNASATSASSISKSTTVKYNVNNCDMEMKINSGGILSSDLKYKWAKVPGLTVGSKYEYISGKAARDSAELSTEYASDQFHGKYSMNPFNGFFNCSGVVGAKWHGNYLIGGEVKGSFFELAALRYAGGAAYTSVQPSYEWSASAVTAPEGAATFGKLIFHMCTKTTLSKHPTHFSSEVVRSLVNGSTSITFGGLWYLGQTGNSAVKAKISNDSKVTVAVSHKVTDFISGSVGAQIENFNSAEESIKFGVKVNISS